MTLTPAQRADLQYAGRLRAGVILISELHLLGWIDAEISRAKPALVHLVRGAYTLEQPVDQRARHRQLCVAVSATHPGLAISHLSAAVCFDLPLLGPVPTEVQTTSIGPRVHGWRHWAGVRVHGQPVSPSLVIEEPDGLRLVGVGRTVTDCARLLGFEEAVVIADAATHRGLTTVPELRAHVKGMARWKGVGSARRMLAAVDPRSESPHESRSRLVVLGLGYPATSQVEIRRGGVLLGRVDLLLDEAPVIVEADGRSKYDLDGDRDQNWWAEKKRHDALVMAGYEVVRLTWGDLDDPLAVGRRLEEAIERTRRRGVG